MCDYSQSSTNRGFELVTFFKVTLMKKERKFRKVIILGAKIILLPIVTVLVIMTVGIIISLYRPSMAPISYEASPLDYWPTNEWKTSTPEEQGMNSSKLIEMIEFYKEQNAEKEEKSCCKFLIRNPTEEESNGRDHV